jgi:putative protease
VAACCVYDAVSETFVLVFRCSIWVGWASDLATLEPRTTEDIAMAEIEVGKVTHYFGRIGVAAVQLTSGSLSVGDRIHIKGHTTDLTQTIESMQVDGKPVQTAQAGQGVGIKVTGHAREHDVVYKILD